MVKIKGNWIMVGVVILLLIFFMGKPKEIKKVTGETVSISTDMPTTASGQLEITFTISSQTDVNLWKVKALDTTTGGWTFFDRYFTGASGPQHNEICSMEADGYYCTMIAEAGSTIAETVTIVYTAPVSPVATVFAATYETYYLGVLQNEGPLSTPQITFIEACGSVGCTGNRIWDTTWGDCDSSGADCGVCCLCSTTGTETYDDVQDGDCSATTCPADGCGVDLCGTNTLGDYPPDVANYCSALFTCTTNDCVGTASCSTDTDLDGWAGDDDTWSNPVTGCYDCDEVGTYAAMKNAGATEVCQSGIDENCDTTSLMGNSEADLDCDSDTIWGELDAYITDWAMSTLWSYPLPPHTITWTLLDGVITTWATQ